jgi:hypothetical protein
VGFELIEDADESARDHIVVFWSQELVAGLRLPLASRGNKTDPEL